MTFQQVIAATERVQLRDLEWTVRSTEKSLPRFEISIQPYRIRFYSRPWLQEDLSYTIPYQEAGYGTREEFLEALSARAAEFAPYRKINFTMRCLRGGFDAQDFTVSFGPDGRVEHISPLRDVPF